MKKILKWIGILLLAGVILFFMGNVRLNKVYDIPPSNLVLPTDKASIQYGKHSVESLCQGCHGDDLSGIDFV